MIDVRDVFMTSSVFAALTGTLQWDIRTFNLLHTVPALDQCQLRFNKTGQIIYGGESSVLLVEVRAQYCCWR